MPLLRQLALIRRRTPFFCSLRLPWKKLCLTVFLLVLLILAFLIFCIWIPIERSESHEKAYFHELEHHNNIESRHFWTHDLNLSTSKPLSYNQRLTPLIHDIAQLSSWGFYKQLQLHENGFAEYPQQRFWIYVGGTNKGETERKRGIWDYTTVYSTPNPQGSCVDEGWICDAYNKGFNRLLEFYHTHGTTRTDRSHYTFMDCDVSPLLCDYFSVDPVMLLHLYTSSPCDIGVDFTSTCSTKWSLVALPLKRMPFSRTVRIGEVVVPVFPSAFEQLKAVVTWDGSLEALGQDVTVIERIVQK